MELLRFASLKTGWFPFLGLLDWPQTLRLGKRALLEARKVPTEHELTRQLGNFQWRSD